MAGRSKLEVRILGDASGLNRAFRDASNSSSRFGNAMKKAGKFAAIGLGAGVAGAVVVLKKSVDAALEAEKAQTRLDAAFKQSGASAKEQAVAMAAVARVSTKAALDDEDLMDTLGRLTRVTGDVTKAQSGMAIAADLARARNLSLEASTKIVEKAYLGNVGALKRIGIEIPKVTAAQDALKESGAKATAEQIKAAKAADDVATRQSAIAALQKQYAGAAEAYGKSAAGAQERFQVAVENLQEQLGAKLLPVLARLATWATTNLPTAFKAISDAAERVWPRVKTAAVGVIDWYRSDLLPTVKAVLKTMSDLWDRFGGDVLRVVKADLIAIRDAINTGLAVIRGDWNKAWRNLLPTVRGTFEAMLALMALRERVLGAAAAAIGRAIVDGIKAGLAQLGNAITAKFHELVAKVRSYVPQSRQAAFEIGRALVEGILAGATGLGARLGNALKGQISGAVSGVKGFFGIRSPSAYTEAQIGKPLAEGIVTGLDGGLQLLMPKTQARLKVYLDKLKALVDAARSRFQASFATLSEKLLRAFDAQTGGHQTAAGKELDAIAARRQQEDLAGAVESAQARLSEAMQGGDPAAIAEAQRALFRAQEDVQMVSLEAQKVTQEQAWTDQRETMRTNLENRLATLSAHFEKEGTTVKKSLAAIDKIMRSFGITFAQSGEFIGRHFVAGLQAAIGGAAAATAGVHGAQTGGNANPKLPPIVFQTYLDSTLVAQEVRKADSRYSKDNGSVVAV